MSIFKKKIDYRLHRYREYLDYKVLLVTMDTEDHRV